MSTAHGASADGSELMLMVEVVSMVGPVWNGKARLIELPGSGGRFAVMAGHVPLLTVLQEGLAMVRQPDGQALWIYLSAGMVEVQRDKVTVLAELACQSDDLEKGRQAVATLKGKSPMALALLTGERSEK